MNEPSTITGNFEIARVNATKGIVSIPILPGTKVPAVRWKEWQDKMPSDRLLSAWFADPQRNIAIITTGLVVFDCDAPAAAELVLRHCGVTPYQVRTPRGGIHLGYRKGQGDSLQNRVKIKGMPIDLRTDGGLAMFPNSRTDQGAYEWLGEGFGAKSDLPIASVAWTRDRRRSLAPLAMALGADAASLLYRGRKYVDRFERAVSGQAGHTTTFISALKIVRFVGFNPHLAWQLLLYYNATKCDPPWEREYELRHKLDDALKMAT